MSILIKGIDIPKKGELQQDELILRITLDGEVAKYDKLFGYRNRYKAVDIPSHGRLIDANELEELFRETITGIAQKTDMQGAYEHMVRASAMVVEMIKDAPTVIESEE